MGNIFTYNDLQQQINELKKDIEVKESEYVSQQSENEIPWQKMWQTGVPINEITGTEYKGINNLLLSYLANKRGYKDNRWCTYEQKKKNKWKFNCDAKGHGIYIEYFSLYNIKEKKKYGYRDYYKLIENNPELAEDFRTIRRSTKVFNYDLIEGVPSKKVNQESIEPSSFIENVINNFAVNYIEKGERACYKISDDQVIIPPSNTFRSKYCYYATQLHELAHSTGHSSRLGRLIDTNFGSKDYAKEELRAEISSSFLMQKLGLEYDEKHLSNHKAYIQNWISLLKDKPSELFNAISDADKIVSYIEDNSMIKAKEIDKQIEDDLLEK